MARLLILEPDAGWRQRLLAVLRAAGAPEATVTAAWPDACLALGHQPYDLALLATGPGWPELVRRLRLIQGDLRIVLLTEADETLEEPRGVQGALAHADLAQQLLPALRAAMSRRVRPASTNGQPPLALGQLRDTIAELGPEIEPEAAVVAHESGLAAHLGSITVRMAVALSVLVSKSWEDSSFPVQVRLLRLPGKRGDWRLYARRVPDAFHVLVLCQPEQPLGVARETAERLATALQRRLGRTTPNGAAPDLQGLSAELEAPPSPDGSALTDGAAELAGGEGATFAIAWRAASSLPAALVEPAQRTIKQIAQVNDCQLHYVNLSAETVHLVVSCPPGRNSLWLAIQFKQGCEDSLKQQFGLVEPLWARGYYARRSTMPLPAHELDLFLDRSQVGSP